MEEIVKPDGDIGGIKPWEEQLEQSLRGHEALREFKGPNDVVKGYLKQRDEVKDLQGKLGNTIPKLPENPTDEEREVYYLSLGKPEKHTDYEIPKPDSGMQDPRMVDWAQKTFHSANLTKEQASVVGKEWNSFVEDLVKSQQVEAEKIKFDEETKFRNEFKTDDEYKAGLELASRFWNKLTDTDFKEVMKEAETWKVPLLLRFIFKAAKTTGEDNSPHGQPQRGIPVVEGIVYDKSPPPPQR